MAHPRDHDYPFIDTPIDFDFSGRWKKIKKEERREGKKEAIHSESLLELKQPSSSFGLGKVVTALDSLRLFLVLH